ncbi:MAG: hypothetical protein JXA13_03165 [Anaerolineales bacterium]|nr:hypothetical protein [Anaerolineales bacterium]
MAEPLRTSLVVEDLNDAMRARTILEQLHFSDWKAAHTIFCRMERREGQSLAGIFPILLAALGAAADPDRSLVNFERFADNYGPALFPALEEKPRVIEILVTLFSASQFLTEILLRKPDAFELLLDRQALTQRKTIVQFQSEARAASRAARTEQAKLDALRNYQHAELLRIGASDFLDLYDLKAVLSQLTRMAIGLTRASLGLASHLTGVSAKGFVVAAMGKLGGWELNYSSDIDLLFIVRDDIKRYIPLAQKFIEIISGTTSEGFLYRVDMRLRPWGRDGSLVSTMDGYLKYLDTNARLWEKQALLKARAIAGDLSLGEALLKEVQPRIYGIPPEEIRANVFAMKKRTEAYLEEKGRDWGEVKLGQGSIRDVEFVLQALQLTHGGAQPEIRTRATIKGLNKLRRAGLVTPTEAGILLDGYVFLRTIEHYLQMLDYQQTYTLPSDPKAIDLLARRLGYSGSQAGDEFVEQYLRHCQAIRAIYLKYIGSESMSEQPTPPAVIPKVLQHLSRMDASYVEIFPPEKIRYHANLAAELDTVQLALVDAVPLKDGAWEVTIVAYDYRGELSIICGLMFVYGFNILDGNVFTYEPLAAQAQKAANAPATARIKSRRRLSGRTRIGAIPEQALPGSHRKIVDVFRVMPVNPDEKVGPEVWARYSQDLINLLDLMRIGQRREARGILAKRVGAVFHSIASKETPLYPIDIKIDNQRSQHYTVLNIDAPDTVGFLYELTNAMAFYDINISRMVIESQGNRVQDILYVTDAHDKKIVDDRRLRELRAAIVLIKHFTHLLPRSPNPEAALLHFREFIWGLFERPNWMEELASIEKTEVLGGLARVLGVSDFLWDDFLRMQYSNLFPVVRDMDALATAKARSKVEAELRQVLKTCQLGSAGYEDWRSALNAFKDRELFRIDMRHILGLTTEFWDFAVELTDLAEIVVAAVLDGCLQELTKQYGSPQLEGGKPCPISVCALGKGGGRELGFASDIELMFVYSGKGRTSGANRITNGEFFERLVHAVVETVQARQEGIFQIDLQLRPYGKTGSLAVALESFEKYYHPDGPAWAYERQALVKLRPVAGDKKLGKRIRALAETYVFESGQPFDVTAMRAMRERQVRHLVKGGTFNAKYSRGGLVDVEYLIQGLQINHGAGQPSVRLTNMREAMEGLNKIGVLKDEDYTQLRKAHTFLRWLIDSMRMVRGNAKDVTVPPYGAEEFAFLARRLLYGSNTERLRDDLVRYANEVQEINLRLLGA